ncbi:MAG TPA: hypothetical protein VK427_25830 [Kofleriaceae bacterium]|nr:hypothetical protein [Kofleriaceae bacterium]
MLLFAGCVEGTEDTSPTAPDLLVEDDESKADEAGPLWAGLPSITLERWVADPCNNGQNALGNAPVLYDSWVRERAGIRNICFEVWKPGVTDWDNPNFWRELDVQVHYRYGASGSYKNAFVPSNGRRGNNRRYAWSLAYDLDPTRFAPSLASLKVPFRIVSEQPDWATIEADMQVHFTVNRRKLEAPSGGNYTVRYQAQLRTPRLAPNPSGYVLSDIVTCEGGSVRFGSGAGYFAANLNHAKAAPLAAGLDGSLIYGVGVAKSGAAVQLTYLSQTPVPGQALPGFSDINGLRITPSGTNMKVELDAYDRALGKTRVVSATFAGCSKAS